MARERERLLESLRSAVSALSQYRLELHRRIDMSTQELIRRYRDNPDLALTALREVPPSCICELTCSTSRRPTTPHLEWTEVGRT